jgi:hypothetical protein
VVGLVWSHDPQSYATGRGSHTRQVKGDDPEEKGYPSPPGWGFDVGLRTPHSKKLIVEQRNKLDRFNDDGRKRTRYIQGVSKRALQL